MASVPGQETAAPGTGPAGAASRPSTKVYSDRELDQARRTFIAQQVEASRSAYRRHDRKAVDQAVRARRAMQELQADALRELLLRRDELNAAEVERVRQKYAAPGRVALEVCRWLERNGTVRHAHLLAGEADRKDDGTQSFPVDADFEFETKAGLVRRNQGWIRFERRRLPFAVPVAVGIDGAANGEAHPLANPNPSDDVSLGAFNEKYAGRYTEWGIGFDGSSIALVKGNRFVDDP